MAVQEKVAALRRFAFVNQTALEKILKKYVRWVATPVACGVLPRDMLESETLQGRSASETCMKGSEGASLLSGLQCSSLETSNRLDRIERDLKTAEQQVMVTSISSYDYMCGLRQQYWAHRERHKTALRENRMLTAGGSRTKRVASILNFQKTWHPGALLVLLLVVPVLTLMVTYHITSQLTMDDGTTPVFTSQGEKKSQGHI